MNVVPKLRTIFGFAFGGVMYKLLLVSDKEEIRSLYRRYAEWNTLGFEQPDVAENAQQGIDLLSHRRYDAISSLLSVSEGKKFFAYLSRRPEMLGMETARDEAHLRREISTARRALSTRDASRQSKQVDDYTKALQGEFFCDLLRGAVRLLFQPAEETDGGALPMVRAGAMEGVCAVYGLHVQPYLNVGQIDTRLGTLNAATNEVRLTVHGRSSHAAHPDEAVDAAVEKTKQLG
mgnify:FL=1